MAYDLYPVGQPCLHGLAEGRVWVIDVVEEEQLQENRAREDRARAEGKDVDLEKEYKEALAFIEKTPYDDLVRLYRDYDVDNETWKALGKRKLGDGDVEQKPKVPKRVRPEFVEPVRSSTRDEDFVQASNMDWWAAGVKRVNF